jgi:hypothetical protein
LNIIEYLFCERLFGHVLLIEKSAAECKSVAEKVWQKNHSRKIAVEKSQQENCDKKNAGGKSQQKKCGKKIAAEKVR